jgi:putative transposase
MNSPDEDKLSKYRRRLPHWRLNHATYFVTWRLHPKQPVLKPAERDFVVSVLSHFDKSRDILFAYVVMDDHVHVIVEPASEIQLQTIVQSWKSFSANRLQRQHGRIGAVWQDEYFDRIIRDEAEFWEKAQYIVNNPLKRWPEVENYQWGGWKILED